MAAPPGLGRAQVAAVTLALALWHLLTTLSGVIPPARLWKRSAPQIPYGHSIAPSAFAPS